MHEEVTWECYGIEKLIKVKILLESCPWLRIRSDQGNDSEFFFFFEKGIK